MRAANFPGRKAARVARAAARAAGQAMPERAPHVADTRFRLGRAARAASRGNP
jgi:hypothetical protein